MKFLKRLVRSEYFPLALLIFANLVTAASTLTRYGEGWDDYNYYVHAKQSLEAYSNLFLKPGQPVIYDPTYRFYGPSFMMLVVLVAKLFPGAVLSDVGHALSFFTFQVGLVIFYLLARRWVKPWAAFGATLLYATQPLLWGHAFINPKDTPFMVGFLASIYFGLRMVDGYPDANPNSAPASVDFNKSLRRDWSRADRITRALLVIFPILILILAAVLTGGIFSLRDKYFPPNFYDPNTVVFEQYLFSILTRSGKIILFVIISFLGMAGLFLSRLPETRQSILHGEVRLIREQIHRYLRSSPMILAAILLGLTASIRFLGLAAGGFIGLFLLWKRGRASLVYLTTYGFIGLMVMYLTWPYLWPAPIFRFLGTVKVMLRFPWPGKVLFEGLYHAPDNLPWYYLPKLIGVQLTEPVVVLSGIGLILLLVQVLRRRIPSDMLNITGVWFFLPLAGAVFGKPYLYDNFRQLHFILPPIFLLSGIALDALGQWSKPPILRAGLLGLLSLPGILGIVQLHPYEYIYYNSLAGGTQGAFRQYEMDYWGTSFRDAVGYINEIAPEFVRVVVWGPVTSAWAYARPDLEVIAQDDPGSQAGTFYALVSSRYDSDLTVFPEAPVLYRVEKDGAILAVIKLVDISNP